VGVRAVVRGFLSKRLGCPVERLDPSMSFAELGVDSLTGVELIRELEASFSTRLYPTLLFEHPVLGDFERQLMLQLPSEAPPAVVQDAPRPSGSVRCYAVDASGGAVRFEETERPAAPLAADEIRVSVGAWGVNFIDVLARVGLHPALKADRFVPGHEIAGTVLEVGADVGDFKPGDRVMGMPGSGGYAEQVVLPARLAMPVPASMGIEEAASLMVTGLTAIACIEQAAQLRRGESVLIQSASGATGSACVRLALHHGAIVYGTASSPEKRAALKEMGVHHVIDYVGEDFEAVIRRTVGSVDVIIDALAGDAITRGISVLAKGGRFIEIGAGAAVQVPQLDPQAMFLNNQAFLGVNLSQMMKRPATLSVLKARLTAAVAEGAIKPVVGHRVPFSQADQAHTLLRERRSIGKIILVR
jgi:myxalamid-type polyketide synthase MxaE and MxaD